MGHKIVKAKIVGKGEREVELLVDTGSTYTWIDKASLKAIGVEKKRKHKFKTIEGKILERNIGEAKINLRDKETSTIVVFAEPEDAKVLGVYALEGLMLEFDPASGKLKPSEIALAV
ncbi:MAG: aspartyl protease family protein [Euryarchaeota archaeon]|nr:aspartyl protease family protein [Euryarchaeota archaeon]